MRNIFYLVSCVLLCSCAARKVKVHAYKQPTLQGARPVAIASENGKQGADVKLGMSYLIYVESAAADLQVKNIWLNKESYATSFEEVQSPVIIKSPLPGAKPDTLVKQTSARVLLVKLIRGEVAMPANEIKKKIEGNELVILYSVKGKDRYYAGALKNLPPLALQ